MKSSVEKGRGFFVAATIAILVIGFLSTAIHPVSSATQTPTGLIVPLYAYPTNPTWNALIQAKQSHPNVPIIAIINPNSGPGSSSDPSYVSGIASLQSAGISVVGYVPTGYASFPKEILRPPRSLAARTYTDIRRWTEHPKGGHFAALEQPRVLAGEIVEFFRSL